ncbi:hypothetical protein [Streptomyces sp. NPDC047974]|uniref:hypothetical protein n=1 Tax=Streptomyces sp. NPDC047974 TaxID=3154343 RepID=UPI0033CE7B46
MEYRQTRARVPLDDAKRRAQKSVNRDTALQENPITAELRDMTEDGYRPGAFTSEPSLHPDIARPDGWRPAGSFSISAINDDTPGKKTNAWTRRMVVDDWSDHDSMGSYADPTHASRFYRSGQPKLGGAVVHEFGEGVEAGYEEPRGR